MLRGYYVGDGNDYGGDGYNYGSAEVDGDIYIMMMCLSVCHEK